MDIKTEDHPHQVLALNPVPAAAGIARKFIAAVLARWSRSELLDSAALIASELVTNAARHATGTITLLAYLAEDRLVLEVWDDSAEEPAQGTGDLYSLGGRGLLVVAGTARDWGWRFQDGRKVVWAVVGGDEGG